MAVTGTTIGDDALQLLREVAGSDIGAQVTGDETGAAAIVSNRDTPDFAVAAINECLLMLTTPSPLNCIAQEAASAPVIALDGATPGTVSLAALTPPVLRPIAVSYNGFSLPYIDPMTLSLQCPNALTGADVTGTPVAYTVQGATLRIIPTPADNGSHTAVLSMWAHVGASPITAIGGTVALIGVTDTDIRYLFSRYVAVKEAKGNIMSPELQGVWPLWEDELFARAEQLYWNLPESVRSATFKESPRQARQGLVSGPKRRKMEEA